MAALRQTKSLFLLGPVFQGPDTIIEEDRDSRLIYRG